jgi:hypothetical protein
MSTAAPQPGNPSAIPDPPLQQREIRIVSHCSLFYWWPVWAVGFIMFLISMVGNHRLAVVPAGTTAHREFVKVAPTEEDKKIAAVRKIDPESKRDALVYPPGDHIPADAAHLHMSNNKNLGVLYAAVLLLVIVITNIPLRGLWSVIIIVLIISISIIFALLEWWETILLYLNFLDIRINAAGYLVISSILFVLWLIVMLLFDRQLYMVFTPGQLRVRLEIGDAETAFDTTGMTLQKQRSDLFRHWILGIGSGDLIVKTSGSNSQEFHMPNVLFIGKKVKEIEEMLRSKQVVSATSGS